MAHQDDQRSEQQSRWNIHCDQIIPGSLAFSKIVFSSTKRHVQKFSKSLVWCNYYTVTRPGRRAQCSGSTGIGHGAVKGGAQAAGSEAGRAGGTGMLFSDPGDEAQRVGRGEWCGPYGVEMSVGHPCEESERTVSWLGLEPRRSSGIDTYIHGSWWSWELRSGGIVNDSKEGGIRCMQSRFPEDAGILE